MTSIQSEEERWLLAMRRGDEDALGRIITKYTAYVGTVVWNIVRGKLGEDEAKEIVSDVFYVLWRNAGKAEPGKLKSYLACIARSRALNALRKTGRFEPLEEDEISLSVPGPEDGAVRREEYRALRRAVDGLDEPDRTIFLRHYYLYQSTGKIAEDMGLNRNTVTTKLRRGRERLKEELRKEGFFHDSEDFGDV